MSRRWKFDRQNSILDIIVEDFIFEVYIKLSIVYGEICSQVHTKIESHNWKILLPCVQQIDKLWDVV